MLTDAIGEWGTVAMSGSEKVGEVELWKATLSDDEGTQQVLARSMMCGRRPTLGVLFGWDGIEEARGALLAARCE
jgi:hypothetical protein